MKYIQRIREILATPPAQRINGPSPELFDYPVAKPSRYGPARTTPNRAGPRRPR